MAFEFLNLDEQDAFLSGHVACPGCVEALSFRVILNAIGTNAMAVVPPSCGSVICGPYPSSALKVPVISPPLETGAASASGIRRALDAQGRHDTLVFVMAGDGGTHDIGFQALSSAAERNEDILYFCYDNEGYMNTGAQKSSSTPLYAATGSTPAGKRTKKKNLVEIMAAHGIPYAATATPGHLEDFVAKIEKAKQIKGLRVIDVHIPCLEGWGIAENLGVSSARLAVETGIFPLYEVEHGETYRLNWTRKDRPVQDYLDIQKRYRHLNPAQVAELQAAVDADWERLLKKVALSAPA